MSGLALKAMLDRSASLFAQTGCYQGLSRLPLKESDPLRFARLREGVEAACVRALGRSRGGFGLHTPEGDVVVAFGEEVGSLRTAIEGVARSRRDDDRGVRPGDAFVDGPRTLVPIFSTGELVAWASGTRLAGCQRIRGSVERLIHDEGDDSFAAFVHEAIEDGRRAFKRRVRALLVPGRYRSAGFADATAAPPERNRIVHCAFEAVVADDGRIAVELCAASAQGPPSFDARGDLRRLLLEQGPTGGVAGNDGARYAIELKGGGGAWADVRGLTWKPIARGMRSRGLVKESTAVAGKARSRVGGYGIDRYPEPTAVWWARERDRLLAGGLIEPLKAAYAESMRLAPAWAAEYRGFWDLPEEFDFDVLTPSTPTQRAAPGKVTPAESVATFLLSADAFQPAGARVEDGERFAVWVAWLQSCVAWDDPIVLPLGQGLNVVRRRVDGELVIRTDAGHDLCRWNENWKMHATVLTWPAGNWMELREYHCPVSGRLLDTEAVAPGYPVIHEYLPDVDGFYRGWLGRVAP